MAPLTLRLAQVASSDHHRVGGKAAQLARLDRSGLRVPRGFVLTTEAYARFVRAARLDQAIGMELGRKQLEAMRWEELWDAALRLRRAFLAAPLPPAVSDALSAALAELAWEGPLAVRSSAIGEDGRTRSFAGLHETILDVQGEGALRDAVRIVWASLWSDAALLYRRELGLDVADSRMAVLVQPQVAAERSGVAFARDPRAPAEDREIIEAVAGRCADLVDGRRDPDRFVLERSSGRLVESRRGEAGADPLLDEGDLGALHALLGRVEALCGWAPDLEWTGRRDGLTVLQARPLTGGDLPTDERQDYRALRPNARRLEELRRRVVDELIPELEAEGARLAAGDVEGLADGALAAAIGERTHALARWREIYKEAFIPFAHGVRALGTLYNDLVRPRDPYEFVGLLAREDLLANQRNEALAAVAETSQRQPALRAALREALAAELAWDELLALLAEQPGGAQLAERLRALRLTFDVAWEEVRLLDAPAQLLAGLLADGGGAPQRPPSETAARREELEARLRAAAGETRAADVDRCLETARLSWRLRDDDNLLLGRVESQLLRAVHEAARRLRDGGRLRGGPAGVAQAAALVQALRDPALPALELPPAPAPVARPRAGRSRPRQLVGQPASPGLASGSARVIAGPADLAAFRPGEVLVCDAIQPQITHLVPLASAVVERRGGMLIHGAIIARELGLPCVNGVVGATELLRSGDLLVVDGHLGVVTVGETELRLEAELAQP